MFAVLFEVEPYPERWDDYMRLAGILRPELLRIDGFFDNRRFASRRHAGRLLSLSLWRDEKAVVRWRAHAGHHAIQAVGRGEIFRDYHLRVGEVVRDNGVPLVQQRLDETAVGSARAVSIVDAPLTEPPECPGLLDWDVFDGVTEPGTRLMLLSWREAAAMEEWASQGGARRLDMRVVRDYGMHARDEAPQFHKPVARPSASG
ncbi:MAG: antibiotic biosynthesis monooxygenase [Rhodospirillales bacterium]|nr:antibiotic biosynthesis monooxygenase [Rhodospirillales bacterium]